MLILHVIIMCAPKIRRKITEIWSCDGDTFFSVSSAVTFYIFLFLLCILFPAILSSTFDMILFS